MSRLYAWQSALTGVLDGTLPVSRLAGFAAQGSAIPPGEGALVYRRSSRAARLAALRSAHPVCRQLLGEACFAGLAGEYVDTTRSTSGDLDRYGEAFSSYIRARIPELPAFHDLPWLGDLVNLEWQIHRGACCGAGPSAGTGLDSLRDPGLQRVSRSAHVRLVHSRWPVHRIWRMHQAEGEPAPLDLAAGGWWLLVESGRQPARVRTVPARLWSLLDACRGGISLAELAARPGLRVDLLGHLLARGWIDLGEHACGSV